MDPSYLSPHVNLAARLESATKQFGVDLLLSADFVGALLVEEHSECVRLVDVARLRGAAQPMRIYTFDDPQADRPSLRLPYAAYRSLFGEGVDLYLAGEWVSSAQALLRAKAAWPDDGVVDALLSFMDASGGVAPPGWPGFRDLEK